MLGWRQHPKGQRASAGGAAGAACPARAPGSGSGLQLTPRSPLGQASLGGGPGQVPRIGLWTAKVEVQQGRCLYPKETTGETDLEVPCDLHRVPQKGS